MSRAKTSETVAAKSHALTPNLGSESVTATAPSGPFSLETRQSLFRQLPDASKKAISAEADTSLSSPETSWLSSASPLEGHSDADSTKESSSLAPKTEMGTDGARLSDSESLPPLRDPPPRPQNAWLLYRNDRLNLLCERDAKRPQGELSKAIAAAWRNEPKDIKEVYEGLARKRKEEHKLKYPDYKYMPRRRLMTPINTRVSRRSSSRRSSATETPDLKNGNVEPDTTPRPVRPSRRRSRTVPSESVSTAVVVEPLGAVVETRVASTSPLLIATSICSETNSLEIDALLEAANMASTPSLPVPGEHILRSSSFLPSGSTTGSSTPSYLSSSTGMYFSPRPSELCTSSTSLASDEEKPARVSRVGLGFVFTQAPFDNGFPCAKPCSVAPYNDDFSSQFAVNVSSMADHGPSTAPAGIGYGYTYQEELPIMPLSAPQYSRSTGSYAPTIVNPHSHLNSRSSPNLSDPSAGHLARHIGPTLPMSSFELTQGAGVPAHLRTFQYESLDHLNQHALDSGSPQGELSDLLSQMTAQHEERLDMSSQ